MWWIIITASISIIIIYLLFAPFFVEIDSTTGLFRIRFHRLARASLAFNKGSVFLKVKIAWWQKEFDLLEQRDQKVKSIKPVIVNEEKRETKRSFSFRKVWRKAKGVAGSFRFRKCYIMIDTGDMPVNGILYPWFYLLSRRIGKTVMINFWGENEIVLQIENSIARMLWAFIKS